MGQVRAGLGPLENMVVSESFGCWDLQRKERAIPTLALEDTKCSVVVLARTLEAAGWAPFTGELVHKPCDVVSIVRFSSRKGSFLCLLDLHQLRLHASRELR